MIGASASYRRTVMFALVLVVTFVLAVPASDEATTALVDKAEVAQGIVDALREELSIDASVQIAIVVYHPFVFSVEPVDEQRNDFRLSMEAGFLLLISEPELRAALAHELGHVWIFTHHPFLQTERLANEIGQRVVDRQDIERLYARLWSYEGTDGIEMEALLGPVPVVER